MVFSHDDSSQTHTFIGNNYNADAAQFGTKMKGIAESDEKLTVGSSEVHRNY